jgi:chromate transporter
MSLQLFWRFVVISALAFGGGQTALPLVERMTVGSGWVSVQDFSTALAFSYVTPGPVLILATFLGYRAAGLAGALSASAGAFLVPWFLATAAAQLLRRVSQSPWLRGFGRGAGPAVVGLLVVTALDVGKAAIGSWPYAVVAVLALALGIWRKVPPFAILVGGAVLGIFIGLAPALATP